MNFEVLGVPQGKARPRVVRNRATGQSMTYTPIKTAAYEDQIRRAYLDATENEINDDSASRFVVTIAAVFTPPTSATKKSKAMMLNNVIKPTKKPDCDNIAKVVCDALNGIAWHDDSQVTVLQVFKEYGSYSHITVCITGEENG